MKDSDVSLPTFFMIFCVHLGVRPLKFCNQSKPLGAKASAYVIDVYLAFSHRCRKLQAIPFLERKLMDMGVVVNKEIIIGRPSPEQSAMLALLGGVDVTVGGRW